MINLTPAPLTPRQNSNQENTPPTTPEKSKKYQSPLTTPPKPKKKARSQSAIQVVPESLFPIAALRNGSVLPVLKLTPLKDIDFTLKITGKEGGLIAEILKHPESKNVHFATIQKIAAMITSQNKLPSTWYRQFAALTSQIV